MSLATLIAIAGTRWEVEESFQTGIGLTGLDEHQVRRHVSWARWTALVMLAHAFLTITITITITAADQPIPAADSDLIPLTHNEVALLLAVLAMSSTHPPAHYVEDIGRDHGLGLQGDELLPCRPGSAWCGVDPGLVEYLPRRWSGQYGSRVSSVLP